MIRPLRNSRTGRKTQPTRRGRKGFVAVLAALLLTVVFAFMAFGIDTGFIVTTQTTMQNGVDAAALAAAQEINIAVTAAAGNGTTVDMNAIAVGAAKTTAQSVAQANGVFIDPNTDVTFGKRMYNSATGKWPITWGGTPHNVVKVTARRTNNDTTQADGKLKLSFGWAVGMPSVPLTTSAIAFVEARDIVVVLDFSGSMNDDSTIAAFSKLGQSNVEANLDQIWQSLVASNVTFPNTTKVKFPSTGFGSINSAAGTYQSSNDSNTVFNNLNLGATNADGSLKHPFPQVGRNGSGVVNNLPSASSSKSKWQAYISYVQGLSGSYNKKYGYRTLVNYLLTQREHNHEAEDLYRTPHYPFHAIKEGATLFADFLTELDFGDELGLVSYDETSRVEKILNQDGVSVNISSDPITSNYASINTIQRSKQAGHYASYTGIGYGLKEARTLLTDHARYGARPTIILMTDGLANRAPSDWSLPSGWDWSSLTDYDDDGTANYSSSNKSVQYAFYEANEAIKKDYTIHTLSVGVDGDSALMEAIAFAGGGMFINVPGGSTVAEMEAQMTDAFRQIAAKVPPPKLVVEEE